MNDILLYKMVAKIDHLPASDWLAVGQLSNSYARHFRKQLREMLQGMILHQQLFEASSLQIWLILVFEFISFVTSGRRLIANY